VLLGKSKQEQGRQRNLDRAVSAWRDAEASLPAERLSAGARANIRVLARQAVPADADIDRPLARLFLPLARMAAAAGVPVLILAVSFGWILQGGSRPETSLSIEISKIDGQAVFDIANGGRLHRVYKSTSAGKMGSEDLFATVRGSFSDKLEGDENLVFYRID